MLSKTFLGSLFFGLVIKLCCIKVKRQTQQEIWHQFEIQNQQNQFLFLFYVKSLFRIKGGGVEVQNKVFDTDLAPFIKDHAVIKLMILKVLGNIKII